MSDDSLNCGDGGGADTFAGLRIGSVFIILATSMAGALFPIMAKRTAWLTVPKAAFEFAKYFGSGVIIATAFIHLLASGVAELNSPCLSQDWIIYPYPLALSMLAIFAIFIVELIAFRWGTAKLAAMGKVHDPHGHSFGSHAAHGPEGNHDEIEVAKPEKVANDIESVSGSEEDKDWSDALGQMIGVAILEFGILLHSVLIGLTLAVDPDFKILFIVIIFHQTFEGLGVGSRLAVLDLPKRYNWLIILGGVLYGITTPIGIAAGLGIKTTYNPDSTKASIVSGVMDSLSSGILLYTGLVELLAHEFLFNKEMNRASNGRLAYALTCMIAGCGIMALLGRWA